MTWFRFAPNVDHYFAHSHLHIDHPIGCQTSHPKETHERTFGTRNVLFILVAVSWWRYHGISIKFRNIKQLRTPRRKHQTQACDPCERVKIRRRTRIWYLEVLEMAFLDSGVCWVRTKPQTTTTPFSLTHNAAVLPQKRQQSDCWSLWAAHTSVGERWKEEEEEKEKAVLWLSFGLTTWRQCPGCWSKEKEGKEKWISLVFVEFWECHLAQGMRL